MIEIRDDETACLACDQGLAYIHGDRIYWRDGCDASDLVSEAEWDEQQHEQDGDTYMNTIKDGGF